MIAHIVPRSRLHNGYSTNSINITQWKTADKEKYGSMPILGSRTKRDVNLLLVCYIVKYSSHEPLSCKTSNLLASASLGLCYWSFVTLWDIDGLKLLGKDLAITLIHSNQHNRRRGRKINLSESTML